MRIIVTGGCGFIGSHICDELQSTGHDVLAFDNLSSGKRDRVGCKVITGDITDAAAVDRAFSDFKPEIVVHTAAQVMLRKSIENPVFDALQNIIGTITVLEACRKHGVKKIIYTSTGGARYGEPERLPVKEDDRLMPLAPYGISKHTAEHYIVAYNKNFGIDYLIVCFGNVYGPRDDPKTQRVMSIFIDKLLKGERPNIFGDGKQTRDFLYVKDIAMLIAHNLTRNTQHKLFNIASGDGASVNRIFELVENELKTGIAPEYSAAINGEVRDIVLDISLARKELDFKPTPLELGIKDTVAWFRKQSAK